MASAARYSLSWPYPTLAPGHVCDVGYQQPRVEAFLGLHPNAVPALC